jgi:hypothetical protein
MGRRVVHGWLAARVFEKLAHDCGGRVVLVPQKQLFPAIQTIPRRVEKIFSPSQKEPPKPPKPPAHLHLGGQKNNSLSQNEPSKPTKPPKPPFYTARDG